MAMGQMGGANMANLAAMEQSRMLAQTLASNNDPKFQVLDDLITLLSGVTERGGDSLDMLRKYSVYYIFITFHIVLHYYLS